jgi:UDP-glucuronate decarboxylase
VLKKILITGGAGFVGSHLCRRLLDNKTQIICLDNLLTGSVENIADMIDRPNFEFVNHDVTKPILLSVDEIYNLACPASPPQYQKDPISTTMTSVLGALNMLDLASSNKAKILQASTSEVYGDPDVHPQPESYRGNVNAIGIRACYDEGKRCAETLFFDFKRQHQVNIKIARIFNTYGPSMNKNDGRVVSNFIVQALQGKNITIYGDGNQTRSFQFIDDLIEGLIKLMTTSQGFTGPVNIGNPIEVNMLELAQKIIQLSDSSSKLVHMPLPEDDPLQRKPVITLAKEELNWEPKVSLDEGLSRTIDYFKQ